MEVMHYARPTKYSLAPYGQIWVAELESGIERYIQLSPIENVALWSKLGDFLESMCTQDLIDACLEDHARKTDNSGIMPETLDSTMFPWQK